MNRLYKIPPHRQQNENKQRLVAILRSNASKPCGCGTSKDGDQPSLGNITYLRDKPDRKTRSENGSKASQLLQNIIPSASRRLHNCGFAPVGGSVELRRYSNGQLAYNGLQRCGLGWLCPECGPKIAAGHKETLDWLMQWARWEGFNVSLMTLTTRHGRRDPLKDLLENLKNANQDFWRNAKRHLPVIGKVTATEMTHGSNGWHPHFHILLIHSERLDAENLRRLWLKSLNKHGLSGNGHAFDLQDANGAQQYVAKFSAAAELALNTSKKGRKSGKTPWQLLDQATNGCKRSAALWREYADAVYGRTQLKWSRGLKAKAGIEEKSEQQLVEEHDLAVNEHGELLPYKTLAIWSADAWKAIRHLRHEILEHGLSVIERRIPALH